MRSVLLRLAPLAFAVAVYHSVTRNYFHNDDFIDLQHIACTRSSFRTAWSRDGASTSSSRTRKYAARTSGIPARGRPRARAVTFIRRL